MLSGLEVLGSFDELARQSAGESEAVDRELSDLTRRLVELRESEAGVYRTLARLRVGDIADGALSRDLDAAERQARSLLSERSDATRELDGRLNDAEADRVNLLAERRALDAKEDESAEAAEAAEAAAMQVLAETQEYKDAAAAAEKAEKVARHAEEKAEFARRDRETKGKPYEDDPLFMYLWKRGYGTSDYDAGFIARFFDRRVARLIDYETARRNYAMLLEIPKRLSEHAERQRVLADEAAERVEEMQQVAADAGDAGEKRALLDSLRQMIVDLDSKLEALEARRDALLEERDELTRGEDPHTREALSLIEAALKRKDLGDLRESALRTPLPEDDTLVDKLRDIEREESEIREEVEKQKKLQAEQRKRQRELEGLRREYRQRGYANQPLDFGNMGMLSILLGEVLNGRMSRDGLWDQLERRRRVRVPGSLGGGRPRRSGGMRMPRMPRGGFGGGFGSRRSGGGGFRTGGSF